MYIYIYIYISAGRGLTPAHRSGAHRQRRPPGYAYIYIYIYIYIFIYSRNVLCSTIVSARGTPCILGWGRFFLVSRVPGELWRGISFLYNSMSCTLQSTLPATCYKHTTSYDYGNKLYVCMYVYVHMYIYIYIHTHACIHTYTHTSDDRIDSDTSAKAFGTGAARTCAWSQFPRAPARVRHVFVVKYNIYNCKHNNLDNICLNATLAFARARAKAFVQ